MTGCRRMRGARHHSATPERVDTANTTAHRTANGGSSRTARGTARLTGRAQSSIADADGAAFGRLHRHQIGKDNPMTEITDGLKAKIRKLLALAEDGRGNEHEAAAASAKVQELLAEYNLDMACVTETQDTDPDAIREQAGDIEVVIDWQGELFAAIARNNFCMRHCTEWGGKNVRRYVLIGRRINVRTTIDVYSYLMSAMARLTPYPDKRTRAHRSWNEGCAARLATRLFDARCQAEAASRTARGERPRGNGSDLVLSDVYSTEGDLNRDFHLGLEPGTSAREREARRNAPPVVTAPETEADRKAREKMWAKWDRAQAKIAAKQDRDAYAMGANAGSQISLNRQIDHAKAFELTS